MFLPIFIFIKILKFIFKKSFFLSYPYNSSLSIEAKNTFKNLVKMKKIKGFFTRKILGYDLFVSQIIPSDEFSETKGSIGLGIDKNKKQSEIMAFGEYIERFESHITGYKKTKMLYKKYSINKKKFINPKKFDRYSLFNKDDEILWQKGEDFINKKNIFLPASLCFAIFEEDDRESMPYIMPINSNGCAAYTNKEEAIKRAICELVERDIFLCYWHSKTSPKIIDPKTFPKNKEFQVLLISDILFKYVKEEGSSLIMVTHDPKLANKAKRKIKIKDGKIK